jgi:L-ascorbate metabolism protein UlaG (beta-lactamase superfamily)
LGISPLPTRRLRFERLEGRELLAVLPSVAGAYLVYNNSAFDGADPAANAADDAAIATDKTPLAAGGTPSFANYSSYDKGINALSIDVKDLGGPVVANSFTFKMGATSDTSAWADAPAPTGFAVRSGAGAGGADRATWTWADDAIKNTWLQVTLSATGATFYFGNTPGESGNVPGNAFVSAADEIGVRTHGGPADVASAYDFNRDGLVDAADETIARNNRRLLSTALPLIATPALEVMATTDSPTVGLAGEVIHFRYLLKNTGSITLTNIDLTLGEEFPAGVRQPDPTGDGDNLLETGETWLYTATATVSQATINAGADIVRTVTAITAQTGSQLARTTSTIASVTGDVMGGLVIRPITHASFLITYQGKAIYADPDGAASLYAGLPLADYILITHSHGDHFDAATIGAIDKPTTKIVAPQAVYNSMSAAMQSLTTVLDYSAATMTPDSVEFLDEMMAALFSVQAVPAYNANHSFGAGNGYVVTIDGKRIYISGDTGAQPELRALEDIDVAFICMNTPFTMTPADAASLVRDMDPLVVYPYHYRNQDGTLGNSITFKNLMSTDFGAEVRLRKWY